MFHENNRIRSRKVQTQSTNARRQKQHVVTGVCVEPIDDILALRSLHATIQTKVLNRRQQFAEDFTLHDV